MNTYSSLLYSLALVLKTSYMSKTPQKNSKGHFLTGSKELSKLNLDFTLNCFKVMIHVLDDLLVFIRSLKCSESKGVKIHFK